GGGRGRGPARGAAGARALVWGRRRRCRVVGRRRAACAGLRAVQERRPVGGLSRRRRDRAADAARGRPQQRHVRGGAVRAGGGGDGRALSGGARDGRDGGQAPRLTPTDQRSVHQATNSSRSIRPSLSLSTESKPTPASSCPPDASRPSSIATNSFNSIL